MRGCLVARAGVAMFCSQCGAQADEGDRYCHQCGRLLEQARSSEGTSVGGPALEWSGRGQPSAPGLPGVELTTLPGPEGASLEVAGFWIRLGGFAIDVAAWWGLFMLGWMIAMGVYFAATGFPDPAATEAEFIPEADLNQMSTIVYAVTWVIVFVATSWFNSVGWSVGKRAVGLRIVRADGTRPGLGRGIGRTLGALLSWMPFGLGFLWAAWDGRHQTWHDKMTETYVVRADSLRAHHERGGGRGSLH